MPRRLDGGQWGDAGMGGAELDVVDDDDDKVSRNQMMKTMKKTILKHTEKVSKDG